MNVTDFYVDRHIPLLYIIICFLCEFLLSYSFPFYTRDLPAYKVPLWCGGINATDIYTEVTGHQLCGKNQFVLNAKDHPNKFGKDFSLFRGNWTAICELDSDGDGMKNGEELGDKECKWKLHDNQRIAISHPGYVEIRTEQNGLILNGTDYEEVCEYMLDISRSCIPQPEH